MGYFAPRLRVLRLKAQFSRCPPIIPRSKSSIYGNLEEVSGEGHAVVPLQTQRWQGKVGIKRLFSWLRCLRSKKKKNSSPMKERKVRDTMCCLHTLGYPFMQGWLLKYHMIPWRRYFGLYHLIFFSASPSVPAIIFNNKNIIFNNMPVNHGSWRAIRPVNCHGVLRSATCTLVLIASHECNFYSLWAASATSRHVPFTVQTTLAYLFKSGTETGAHGRFTPKSAALNCELKLWNADLPLDMQFL